MHLSRRHMLALMGTTGAAALLGSAPTATGAVRRLAAPRFPGDPGSGRLFYGSTTPYYQDLTQWEAWLGRPLAARRTYYQASQAAKVGPEAAVDLLAGRMPHASIKPPGTWQSVAAGAEDAWLGELLGGVGAVGRPMFLTLHHEPEDDAASVGEMRPADWVAMQERAIGMAAVRAPMVTIVPVLMGWTFETKTRRPADWVVPSAKVFGFDTYNSWSPTNGKRWLSFGEKVDRVLPWAGGRPLVVGEYGCREDPADHERAVLWMRDAFGYARENNVVCMSYFNSMQNSPDGSWELDGRRAEVFRTLLGRAAVARP